MMHLLGVGKNNALAFNGKMSILLRQLIMISLHDVEFHSLIVFSVHYLFILCNREVAA